MELNIGCHRLTDHGACSASTPTAQHGLGCRAACGASDYVFGFDIIDATGLTSGTVYPALDRLEEQRLLRSTWEDEAASTREKRPPRRYFALTAAGAQALAAGLAKYRVFRPIALRVES